MFSSLLLLTSGDVVQEDAGGGKCDAGLYSMSEDMFSDVTGKTRNGPSVKV